MVDNFIERKHGREEISYPDSTWQHEDLKPILEPTYGIILYQEQVMQIAQVLAGYTLGGADMLRRAMGKKIQAEMDKQRKLFVDGAVDNSVDEISISLEMHINTTIVLFWLKIKQRLLFFKINGLRVFYKAFCAIVVRMS